MMVDVEKITQNTNSFEKSEIDKRKRVIKKTRKLETFFTSAKLKTVKNNLLNNFFGTYLVHSSDFFFFYCRNVSILSPNMLV